MRLLTLIARSLELPPDHFDSHFDPPMAFLRPLRYSRNLSKPTEGVFGAGAHTDYGMLTILATDGQPGLQVCLGGEWVDVAPGEGRFVCNLGDMLERCVAFGWFGWEGEQGWVGGYSGAAVQLCWLHGL